MDSLTEDLELWILEIAEVRKAMIPKMYELEKSIIAQEMKNLLKCSVHLTNDKTASIPTRNQISWSSLPQSETWVAPDDLKEMLSSIEILKTLQSNTQDRV